MIISKTPYRISFFGGGSDYPEWFAQKYRFGEVISSTIDKHVYISIRELRPFFGFKYRLSYSKIEETNLVKDIQHKVIKALLSHYNSKIGLEIHYDGDLPSKSGMGSSSSFTVGLINSYFAIQNKKISKKDLALKSIELERDILKESVGVQDQISLSYGGFNIIRFNKENFSVKKLNIEENFYKNLNKNFFLIYTGQQRFAHIVANSFIRKLNKSKEKVILKILDHVNEAKNIIKKKKLDDFGNLLNETWEEKKKLSSLITNEKIDEIYSLGIKSGSLGGKLLGAGNGGFLLFYVPKKNHEKFNFVFRKFIKIPFKFTQEGSEIIFKN